MTIPPPGPEYYDPPEDQEEPQPREVDEDSFEGRNDWYDPRAFARNLAADRLKNAETPKVPRGFAITALVVGIVAVATGWIPIVGAAIGAVAIVFAFIALGKKQPSGMAKIGALTGFVAAIVSVGVTVHSQNNGGWFWPAPEYLSIRGYYGDTVILDPDGGASSLKIVEQAFGQWEYSDFDERGRWWYLVVLENPHERPYGTSEFTVRGLDDSGAVVAGRLTFRHAAPGKMVLVGEFRDVGDAQIHAIQVEGPPDDALRDEPYEGSITVDDFDVEETEWSTSVTGTVTNTYKDIIRGGYVAIIARDSSGNVLGATDGWFDELRPGKSGQFAGYFFDPPTGVAQYELIAWPW